MNSLQQPHEVHLRGLQALVMGELSVRATGIALRGGRTTFRDADMSSSVSSRLPPVFPVRARVRDARPQGREPAARARKLTDSRGRLARRGPGAVGLRSL